MLKGSLVALVTPMFEDGSLDWDSYRRLIDFHLAQGTDGIVVVGTTGESPTVNVNEHVQLIEVAVKHAAGRIPIIAGTGANSTAEAIELTQAAQQMGADACLSVVPYYNRPTQEGLYRHYQKIVEAVDLPLLLYNVPGRTVADLHNETVLKLTALPHIIGIKDATGNIERCSDLIRRVPPGFLVLSGDDGSALACMMLGGQGVISVTANVAPKLMHEMCAAAVNNEFAKARMINEKLLPLHSKLFVEANPIPVKWAVAKMGLMQSGIRLPLTPLSESYHAVVTQAMQNAGVSK